MPRRAMIRPAFLWALVVAISLLSPRHGRAQCPPGVQAWVDEASRALSLGLRPVECHPGLARVRLFPAGARPIDIEVSDSDGPAFRHVGRLRVSPIVEVPDYRSLPAPQRAAFEAVVDWLAAHTSSVSLTPPSPQQPVGERASLRASPPPAPPVSAHTGNPWPWLAALAALFAWMSVRNQHVPVRHDARDGVLLASAALVLRLVLSVWGPFHVNGQGALWIRAAVDGVSEPIYGPGYPELFHWLTVVVPRAPDFAVFAFNALLSSLAPALVFFVGRAAGLGRRRALAAGVILAVDPLAIHIAATEAYFTAIITLTLAHWLSVALFLRHAGLRHRAASVTALLGAGLAAASAARIHPVGWTPLALSPLIALAFAPPGASMKRTVSLLAVAYVAIAGIVLATSGTVLLDVARAAMQRSDVHAMSAAGWSSSARMLTAVVGLALAAAWVFLARPRALAVAGVAYLAADIALRGVYAQSADWIHAFDRLYFCAPLLGLAALSPRGWAERRAFVAVMAAGAIGWMALDVGALRRRTTEQLEYRWLRPRIAGLARECRPVFVGQASRRLLFLPDYLARGYRRGFAWATSIRSAEDAEAALSSAPCVVYVRSSVCSSQEARAVCDDVERTLGVRLEQSTRLVAAPSYDSLPYDRAIVMIGLAHLTDDNAPMRTSPTASER